MFNPADNRFPELIETARAYCRIIEHVDDLSCRELIAQASSVLPRLHAAVTSLSVPPADPPAVPLADLEKRFALYTRLRRKLGACDAYWLEYDDQTPESSHKSGSLADDLTDIYFELKCGLQLVDEGDPTACAHAASDWRSSFRAHWGEHLLDAERHLFRLLRDQPA